MKYVVALVFASGCLSVPGGHQAQCTSDSDCETSLGEVCDQGLCWGGPPQGQFAAIVVPPADRTDLISSEMPMATLPTNGDLGNVQLETPVTISGRVEPFCATGTCTSTSIAATITVTRAPLFPGGPGFKAVTTAKDGLPRGSNSFSIAVPRTNANDPDYVVTIVPDGNGDLPPANGTTSAAQLAPPGRMTLRATDNTDTGTIVLGTDNSKIITGNLVDSASHPLAKYRVVALGRLSASDDGLSEVSTVDYTPNGTYSVTLADGALGPLTIEAKPYDQNVVAPTLYMSGLAVENGAHNLAQPATLGNKKLVAIQIQGLSGDGAVEPVSGAHVVVTGTYTPPLQGGTLATLSVDATTGPDGLAHVTLLDGASLADTYKLRVVPTASAELGVIYDKPFALTDTMPQRLPPRIAVRGHVVAREGQSAGKIAITASASLRFTWTLPPEAQEFLGEIPAATAVTSDSGDFVIWVDPAVATVWGRYDLDFVAPNGVDSASWSVQDIEMPRVASQTSVDLGDQPIPDTAYMHGHITDPSNFAVTGGELRIFELVTDTSLCAMVPYKPQDCVIPATLLGHATSDDHGAIRLPLPR